LVRGGEVPLGFQVEAGETLIVEHALGGFVAVQENDVMAGGLDGGRLSRGAAAACRERSRLWGLWARQATARQADSRSAAGRIAFILKLQQMFPSRF
jgi:hypothetical protein